MTSETYERILETAKQLFITQGYTATSMRQIAEVTGIGKATIYHHFPDKTALVMTLLENNLSSMDNTLSLVRAEQDPRRRIEVAVEYSLGFLLESVNIMQIVRREVPGGREKVMAHFSAFFRDFIDLLQEAVRKGTDQGLFRPVDPNQAAKTLMTMIQGTFAMAYVVGERARTSEQAAQALLDVYFKGIETR
jgi:TetR/AcrR family transcriptional repressor of nem operon